MDYDYDYNRVSKGIIFSIKDVINKGTTAEYYNLFVSNLKKFYDNNRNSGKSRLVSRINSVWQSFGIDWAITKLRHARITY